VARPFKILSDFDGVWTDQANEAAAVRRFAIDEIARVCAVPRLHAEDDYDAFVRMMKATPHEHGWAPDGRITAYVDEDPLCESSSIAHWLAVTDDPRGVRVRDAIVAAGFATVHAFSEHLFHGGVALFRSAHPPWIVPGARAMLDALHARGAELVIVSNSSSEKLVDFFQSVGIDASEDDGHELRVRGSAGKWKLDGDATIEIGGRSIFVDRPAYRALVADEAPDLIVGDVFSLDLAMPHVMRSDAAAGAPRLLVLRRHPHTPSWVLDRRADGAIDAVVDQVGDLADSIERWRR
jgi:phosphoglycolate phosphatase-like HAD superfamily hydrolase